MFKSALKKLVCSFDKVYKFRIWAPFVSILFFLTLLLFRPVSLVWIFHFWIFPNTEQALLVIPGINDHCSQQVLSYCPPSGRHSPMKFTSLSLQWIPGRLLFFISWSMTEERFKYKFHTQMSLNMGFLLFTVKWTENSYIIF